MTVDTKMPFLVPVFYVCIQVSACTVQAVTKGLLFWPSMSVWLPGGGGGGGRGGKDITRKFLLEITQGFRDAGPPLPVS